VKHAAEKKRKRQTHGVKIADYVTDCPALKDTEPKPQSNAS
jgi:hypothetical protein